MSRHGPSSVSSRAPLGGADLLEPRSFEDLLYDQFRKTPWVGASVLVHGAVLGCLLVLPGDPAQNVRPQIVATIADPIEDLRLEDPVDPPPTMTATEVPRKPEELQLPEEPPESEFERDNEQPTKGAFGDPRFLSAGPVDAFSTTAIIGIGPGGGGPFGDRTGGHKNSNGSGGNGRGTKTGRAVDAAMDWLERHQSPEGHWDCDGFSAQCKGDRCDGAGEAVYDPGVTGLALLTYLGAGETHVAGDHKDVVKRGLSYLRRIQDSEGCFGPRTAQHFQYNHTIATLAMAEAYGLSGSRQLKDQAQRAIGFIQQSQNPYLAWRYGVRDGDNDTSVTGWAVMALKSAKLAGLEVDGGALRDARGWVDKMTEPEFGRVGYQRRGGQPARTAETMERFPADKSESMTAAGVLVRIFSGEDPRTSDAIEKGAALMAKKPPVWDVDGGSIDMYYWYYGTLAMHQVGGDAWKQWNEPMQEAIVSSQRTQSGGRRSGGNQSGSDAHGSWDPIGPWGADGGRVYATAVQALSLQVYYRYKRVADR